jgi:hypothetical protein
MSIQSNINQGLSLTGLLITQTAGYKSAAKAHELDVKVKKTEKQIKIVEDDRYNVLGFNKTAEAENLREKSIELQKEAFDTAPTKGRHDAYAHKLGSKNRHDQQNKIEDLYAANAKAMRERADAAARSAQEARLETRKRILTGTPSEHLLKENT